MVTMARRTSIQYFSSPVRVAYSLALGSQNHRTARATLDRSPPMQPGYLPGSVKQFGDMGERQGVALDACGH